MERWKSPREIDEEVRLYKLSRFEHFMSQVDDGTMTEAEALEAIRAEENGTIKLDSYKIEASEAGDEEE